MNLLKITSSVREFFNTRRTLALLITSILMVFVYILLRSEGFNGGEETLLHYSHSRWAFSNPNFFLDSAAGPIFTLLSAPFAAMGFKMFQLFNILLGLASSYIAYLIAKELKMKSPILAIVICCFTPVFINNLFSGITEVLFGFAVILSSYLLIKNKYTPAAIILSFLPLIRPEGYLLIPIYAGFLIAKKHYKEIAYLFIGFVAYSIIGAIAGKDFFWLFSDISIGKSNPVYGTGYFLQYIKRSPGFFGIANEIFFVTGLVAGVSLYFRKKKDYSHEFFLVVLPFLVYFFAHSLAWCLGYGNSKGVTQYMVAIVPLMAVMATRGLVLFSLMFEIIFKSKTVRQLALAFAFISIIILPFYTQDFPIDTSNTDRTIREASLWIKDNTYARNKVYYTDPSFYYYHDINPFDTSIGQNTLHDASKPQDEMNDSDILLVDELFAPPLGFCLIDIINNPNFELLKIFEPEIPNITFERKYMVGVFRKTNASPINIKTNKALLEQLSSNFKTIVSTNFNNPTEAEFIATNIETERSSSNRYARISRHTKYSLIDTITLADSVRMPVTLRIEMKQSKEAPDENLVYVVEVHYNGVLVTKKDFQFSALQQPQKNQWHTVDFHVLLPEITDPKNTTIVTYIWNKYKKGFLIDDYIIGVKMR